MGGPLVTAYANDEGSTTVISGANVGGGSHKSSDNPKSEREGWYEFEGYNLTLKYDSGRIDRFLTFTTGDNYEQIWFEGDSMQRK